MKIESPIIRKYKATWHDNSRNGSCFDEIEFYTITDLVEYLKISDESIKNRYEDTVKVWAQLFDGKLIEICNIRR